MCLSAEGHRPAVATSRTRILESRTTSRCKATVEIIELIHAVFFLFQIENLEKVWKDLKDLNFLVTSLTDDRTI